MSEIIIKKPYIKNNNGKSKLIFEIEQNDASIYKMYFEVEQRFEKYLTYEVSDACLVCILLYAMEHNKNIRCEGKVSYRLLYQLENYLIPAISKNIKRYNKIKVFADVIDINFNSTSIGTGLSCGVDSFYSILKGLERNQIEGNKITHLCFFNAGSQGMFGGEKAREIFLARANKFKKVAEELKCDFLICDSNMNEFLMQEHEMTHVFRTLAIPLALQKLFKLYYFSSSYEYKEFKFTDFDPSYYDILTIPNLSNDTIRFELCGGETTRLGKIEYISQFDITYNYLNVCIDGVENCGKCRKCKRTILDLYLVDKLDNYSKVFDLNDFKSHKHKWFRWAIQNRWRVDMPEIVQQLNKKHEINIIDYIIAYITLPIYVFSLIRSKLKFKIWKKKNLNNKT